MHPAPIGGGLLGSPSRDDAAIAGGLEGRHVLVALLSTDPEAVSDQLEVATALARSNDVALSIVNSLTRTNGRSTTTGRPADDGERLEGGRAAAVVDAEGPVRGVLSAIRSRDVDTLVLPGPAKGGRIRTTIVEQLAARADCDTIVVNGRGGYEPAPSILLPIAGGPHSGLATDVARRIATATGAWIDVLHVLPEDTGRSRRERARRLLDDAVDRIDRDDTTSTWLLESDDVAGTLVEQSRYYELMVIGAPTRGRLHRLLRGSKNRSIRKRAGSVVLSVRDNGEGSR